MTNKTKVVTVRLTEEQYAFFSDWQTKLETETGIEVPMGAVLRRALEGFIHFAKSENRAESAEPHETEARKQASAKYVAQYKKTEE